jgi:hypothetical protein
MADNKTCTFRGKKCITYDGKRILYTNKADLVNKFVKMGMRQAQAREWATKTINNQTKRVVIDADGNFEVFDTKDNFKGMLRTNFNVKAVRNATVIQGGSMNKNDVVHQIKPHDKLKFGVQIILFVNWPSPYPVSEEDISNNGKVVKTLLQERVDLGHVVVRRIKLVMDVPKNRISHNVENHVKMLKDTNYFRGGTIIAHKYNILTSFTNKLVERSEYFLGEIEYKLTEWANIEYLGPWEKGGDSCAVKFISKRFPGLYWEIKALETDRGITLDQFENFCNSNGIMFFFYDVSGSEIMTNLDDEAFENVSLYHYNQVVRAIVYERHIYPFSGGQLKRVAKNPKSVERINNAEKKFYRIWKSGILPSAVKIDIVKNINTSKDEPRIIGFVHDNVRYFQNSEYDKCVKILKAFGVTENIPFNVSIIQIPSIVMKARRIAPAMLSFFPEKENFKMNAIMYQKEGSADMKGLKGTDKNKAYAWGLAELPYLISHDWRKHAVVNVEGREDHHITDHYLYSVKAKYFTVMLPKSDIYPGYHLKKCLANGIEFDLIEEYETVQCHNYYREIIYELYKNLSNEEFKKLMVITIGKLERSIHNDVSFKFDSIQPGNKDNHGSEYLKAAHLKETSDYKLLFDTTKTIQHVRDSIPINIQIKSQIFCEVSAKIKELGLSDEDVDQINTDSLWHYGAEVNVSDEEKEKMRLDFNGWKILDKSTYKHIKYAENDFKNDNTVPRTLELVNDNSQPRILHTKYAGNGKTHYIMNDLIPRLEKQKITYIVITPTHSTLDELKEAGINCEILAKFCFSNAIPDEQYIIIDEIGFGDAACHDFIYKLNIKGKAFECFGDFNQLLGVGEEKPYNQPHYLKYMFSEIRTEFSNFRNNFTKEYYDALINASVGKSYYTTKSGKEKSYFYLIEQVNKYSTNSTDAEVCICFRNETRDYQNNKILKRKKLEPYSVGTKLICVTNALGEEYGIWNHKQVDVIGTKIIGKTKKGKHIYGTILQLNKSTTICLPEKRVPSHFRHAYCINVYESQGKTFSSYHWVKKDNSFLKMENRPDKLSNRIAYTVISRIKQELPKIVSAGNYKLLIGFRKLDELENGKFSNKKHENIGTVDDGDLR